VNRQADIKLVLVSKSEQILYEGEEEEEKEKEEATGGVG
jgi:hypothetical protein